MDDARPERRAAALELLEALERGLPYPGPPRVGLTGAPGAGKSTLLDALVRTLRERGESVGVVAVDPSSRRSGGALLGDRIRLRSRASDEGVFFRSMAARERLGGLAEATRASMLVLCAVFDRVFVETVGVGQSESDVSSLTDTTVYVAQPGAGDMLQFMKAGVLELPDVFAVNKSDLGAVAARTTSELAAGLGLSQPGENAWTPPVLQISARDARGIDTLLDALDAHRDHLEASALAERRAAGARDWALETLSLRYGSFGLAAIGGRAALAERLAADPLPSAFAAVRSLGTEIEEALRKA